MNESTYPNLFARFCLTGLLVIGTFIAGCSSVQKQVHDEIILYNWVDYIPQVVLDAFEVEYGIHVDEPNEIISIALIALGYPLNSEDPAQLEAALKHLLAMKNNVIFVAADVESATEALISERIIILHGWNGDAIFARKQNSSIQYVLPDEGTLLWADSFVISASSPNQSAAEMFLNFILRPEISAHIVESYYYPSANEAAREFIDPSILNNPAVYPPLGYLRANDFYLPLSKTGEKLYANIWKRFLAGPP